VNASYLVRLATLSLACFFVLNVVFGAVLACTSGLAIRLAARLRARSAARLLFALRISPATLGLGMVATLCVPSYLWLEPETQEEIGMLCAAAAIAAVILWIHSFARSARAVVESHLYLRSCRKIGEPRRLAGEAALVVPSRRTTVLAGLFRPIVVVSQDVLDALPEEQLAAAVRHERSHAASRDNWKRLAILLAPGVFPFRQLEQAWWKFSEWAADDLAVAGDRRRSLALADALVRVARMGVAHQPSAVTTSLLGADFSARIDRLLNGEPVRQAYRWQPIAGVALALAVALLRPSMLDLVHRALERLIH